MIIQKENQILPSKPINKSNFLPRRSLQAPMKGARNIGMICDAMSLFWWNVDTTT